MFYRVFMDVLHIAGKKQNIRQCIEILVQFIERGRTTAHRRKFS